MTDEVVEKIAKKPMAKAREYAKKYGKAGHTGDELAVALECTRGKDGVDVDMLRTIAKANGLDASRWNHLNDGMKRMNLGNALRGLHNKGTDVNVNGTIVPGAAKQPKGEAA